MAGHADAQGIAGSGTSGEAVGLLGAAPMYSGISDEHYWNLVLAHAVTILGRQRGLRIDFYKPPVRTILDPDDPGTNWSVGRQHALADGYAFEIHFDAYGSAGVGSGLIPPLHRPFSRIDESLAQEFGAYPMNFRDRSVARSGVWPSWNSGSWREGWRPPSGIPAPGSRPCSFWRIGWSPPWRSVWVAGRSHRARSAHGLQRFATALQ